MYKKLCSMSLDELTENENKNNSIVFEDLDGDTKLIPINNV